MVKPVFTTTERDGGIALWVTVPDHMTETNIWDLEPREFTIGVQKAIMHAFFLGVEAQTNVVEGRSRIITGDLSCEFSAQKQEG